MKRIQYSLVLFAIPLFLQGMDQDFIQVPIRVNDLRTRGSSFVVIKARAGSTLEQVVDYYKANYGHPTDVIKSIAVFHTNWVISPAQGAQFMLGRHAQYPQNAVINDISGNTVEKLENPNKPLVIQLYSDQYKVD